MQRQFVQEHPEEAQQEGKLFSGFKSWVEIDILPEHPLMMSWIHRTMRQKNKHAILI